MRASKQNVCAGVRAGTDGCMDAAADIGTGTGTDARRREGATVDRHPLSLTGPV